MSPLEGAAEGRCGVELRSACFAYQHSTPLTCIGMNRIVHKFVFVTCLPLRFNCSNNGTSGLKSMIFLPIRALIFRLDALKCNEAESSLQL